MGVFASDVVLRVGHRLGTQIQDEMRKTALSAGFIDGSCLLIGQVTQRRFACLERRHLNELFRIDFDEAFNFDLHLESGEQRADVTHTSQRAMSESKIL